MATFRASSSSKRSASSPKVVAVLAGLLERAAKRGDACAGSLGSAAAAFRSPGGRRPEIGVRRYAERIYRYAGCSPACFVVAYAYLDRLALGGVDGDEEEGAGVAVDSYSVHRLLITSVMVAAKFMDDIHYNNAYFARVGGVEVSEMNGLELDFLFALRFRLNVTPDDFAAYCSVLHGHITTTTPLSPTTPLALMTTMSPEEEEEEKQHKDGAAVVGITTFAAAAHPARIPAVAEITQ